MRTKSQLTILRFLEHNFGSTCPLFGGFLSVVLLGVYTNWSVCAREPSLPDTFHNSKTSLTWLLEEVSYSPLTLQKIIFLSILTISLNIFRILYAKKYKNQDIVSLHKSGKTGISVNLFQKIIGLIL